MTHEHWDCCSQIALEGVLQPWPTFSTAQGAVILEEDHRLQVRRRRHCAEVFREFCSTSHYSCLILVTSSFALLLI
ncbi:unnamed protein product [Amoebophrya sp. A25]|nr:unnamed protein product [Amoebophrya sp. A25]|eukprot:GSA25T00023746001.1